MNGTKKYTLSVKHYNDHSQLMKTISSQERKNREIAHGKNLAANAIDVWGWGTPAGRERAHRRVELLIHYANLRPGMKILEFGCGTGLFSHLLVRVGFSLVGIDLSPDLIAEAMKTSNPRIEFRTGDIEALDFPNETYDAVVGSSVLHHVHIEKALLEARRVLKSDGRIAFAEPNMMNPQIAVQKNIPYVKQRMGDSPDETALFRWRTARVLRQIGFEDVCVKPFDFLHPSIPEKYIMVAKRIGKLFEATPLLKEIAGSIILSGRKP